MLNLFCLHRLKSALLYVSDSSPVTVPHILKTCWLTYDKEKPRAIRRGAFLIANLVHAGAGLEGV